MFVMKQNLLKLTLCAACLCAGGLLARAAGLQRADVIADPVWLLHLDCDALRTNALGQFVLAQMDKPEAKARLASFQTIFGFDLRSQVHGVTLYGSSQKPADSVLIIYADFDADRLMTLAKAPFTSTGKLSAGEASSASQAFTRWCVATTRSNAARQFAHTTI